MAKIIGLSVPRNDREVKQLEFHTLLVNVKIRLKNLEICQEVFTKIGHAHSIPIRIISNRNACTLVSRDIQKNFYGSIIHKCQKLETIPISINSEIHR
jgi:hypothetical protein